MLKIHGVPFSAHTRKVILAAIEKKIAYEIVPVVPPAPPPGCSELSPLGLIPAIHKTRLLEQGDQDKPDYRALQPFGQVPILKEDGIVLFESGAIALYVGERSETLLPREAGARARATQWLIAALDSIEPFVMSVASIDLFYANEEWAKLRRPGAVEFVQRRLSALSKSLGDKPYLDGEHFTAGDLMMTTVLRILKHTDIVTSDRRLAAYVERCTARPAFGRAFDAQIGDFRSAA